MTGDWALFRGPRLPGFFFKLFRLAPLDLASRMSPPPCPLPRRHRCDGVLSELLAMRFRLPRSRSFGVILTSSTSSLQSDRGGAEQAASSICSACTIRHSAKSRRDRDVLGRLPRRPRAIAIFPICPPIANTSGRRLVHDPLPTPRYSPPPPHCDSSTPPFVRGSESLRRYRARCRTHVVHDRLRPPASMHCRRTIASAVNSPLSRR